MNLAQILDTSARILASADCLLDGRDPVPDAALYAFWVHSREMSHQWMQSLAVCQKVLESGDLTRSRQCWLEYEPAIREILRADVLQRTWYVILLAADRQQQITHSEPIARSALSAFMQTRIRALKLVLAGHRFDAARMRSLNHLRHTAEAWSDFLCAQLAFQHNATEILFDEARAQKWSQIPVNHLLPELNIPGHPASLLDLNRLLLETADEEFPLGPLPRLTRKILQCFPPNSFDDLRSPRLY